VAFPYQGRNQATMVFYTKAPLSWSCWNRLLCKGRPLMEQHIIVGMEFKLMLCQTESKVFWAGNCLSIRGTGGPGANECRGGRPKRQQTGKFASQYLTTTFFMRLCPSFGTHSTSSVVRDGACSSLAGELHIVDHVALPPPCCCNDNSATSSSHSAAPPAKRKSILYS
jgi:hypothetical protein